MNTNRRNLLLAGIAVLLAHGMPITNALAIDAPALYTGPEREQRLLEGAKREGRLNIYSSMTAPDLNAVTDAFQKKYGIKVNAWRSGSEKVLQRTVTEDRGGRHEVDIVETNGPEMEALHRENIFTEVVSPHIAGLIPSAMRPHRGWIGTRMQVFVQAYNTNLVSKDDLPKSYYDLLDPKWKGKLSVETEDIDWFAGLIGQLGEDKGLQLFRDIVAKNGITARKGHSLLVNLVASGEVPLALTVYNHNPEGLMKKGASIDWFTIPPAISRLNGVGMAKKAPHPHAAVLFLDFLLTDGQKILAQRGFIPTAKTLDSPLKGVDLTVIDPALVLDHYAKWSRLYKQIFVERSK